MHAILQATSGPAAGLRIVVRQGQVVQVGRTAWADYSLPGDASLSDRHFALECDFQGCRIRDLNSATGITVNGTKVTLESLRTGDHVAAGQTIFSVFVEGTGESAMTPGGGVATDAGGDTAGHAPAPTAADYCQSIELSEPAQGLLQPGLLPAAFLELLIAHELFPDAVLFLAFWLPKPLAVRWGCQCVRGTFGESLTPRDQQALACAQNWAAETSEEHRQAAGAVAEANHFDGAANWVAVAAFWSGGSLAPPELAPVPPGPALTARAITGSLLMAAAHGDPRQMADRYRGFLAQGQKLVPATG